MGKARRVMLLPALVSKVTHLVFAGLDCMNYSTKWSAGRSAAAAHCADVLVILRAIEPTAAAAAANPKYLLIIHTLPLF